MYHLSDVGLALLEFGVTLLIAQALFFLTSKIAKKDYSNKSNWFNFVLAILFTVFCCNDASYVAGIVLIIVMLVIAILGNKKAIVSEKRISDWVMGIGIAVVGICTAGGLYPSMFTFVLLGAIWIYLLVFMKKDKLFKISKKNSLSCLAIVVGLIVYAIGNNANYNTAHVETSYASIKLGKKSATISGYATPDAKVKTYLDSEEITPAEKSDSDGYFEFNAEAPGKWTVKVTKNGKTATDYTVVEKSSAWKKYQAKKGSKEAREDFAVAYADAFEKLDSLGVDEHNTWADADNEGTGGTIDDTLENIQKKNAKNILEVASDFSDMEKSLKRLRAGNANDYNEYRSYYTDIKKLESTVLNPPAGEIDNFTDDFEDQRNTVNANLDLIY